MDVHKESIDVATGDDAAGEVRHYGSVGGDLAAVARLCRKLESTGKALFLRNDIRYCGKTAWTAAHRRWIAELKFPHAAQHIAFEEYVQAVDEAGKRIERLETAIRDELGHWRWKPVVEALEA